MVATIWSPTRNALNVLRMEIIKHGLDSDEFPNGFTDVVVAEKERIENIIKKSGSHLVALVDSTIFRGEGTF